ncbi:LysR substrate-binding domain-containing protein [Vibrio sp. E150_011]
MKSTIDLNLLKVLPLLNQHRKLKEVARVLGKSEASVSKYLARLREQFDDELFSLDAYNGYEPTAYMLSILPSIDNSLETLDNIVDRTPFDPLTVTRTITITWTPFAQFFLGHLMVKRLTQTFPNASFRIITWNDNAPKNILDEKIDLGFHLFNDLLPKSIYQQKISHRDLVLITPASLKHLSLEQVLALPFVLPVLPDWQELKPAWLRVLEEKEIELDIVAYLDNFSSIFKAIELIQGATITTEPPTEMPGYTFKKIDAFYNETPPGVALVKLKNRHNALHQTLIEIIKEILP